MFRRGIRQRSVRNLLRGFVNFAGWAGCSFSGAENWQAYNTDGNAAVCGAAEQSALAEGWRRIAAFMAPFDVNVSTVQPANLNDTTKNWSWSMISPNIVG